ncbi:MAG TPA: polyketide synthase, partial [Acidobacteria bacterium]|nr:polyketide synthase [Acidobacteriota bacterium]
LRAPVRFAQGVGELLQEPRTVLLEVGPGTALATLARRSFAPGAAPPPVLSALSHPREPRHGEECLLTALGRLWLAGVAIDWPAVWRGERRQRVALPTYPFERRR